MNLKDLHLPDWYINKGFDKLSDFKDSFNNNLNSKLQPLVPYAEAINNYDPNQNPWSNVNNNGSF